MTRERALARPTRERARPEPWASPWRAACLAAGLLAGCTTSSPYGSGEPCGFSFLDDEMEEAAWCEVALDAFDPCVDVAICFCEARSAPDTDELDSSCVVAELGRGSGERWIDFCAAEEGLSMAEALRAYAAVKEAEVTTVGFCEAFYPDYREP